MTTENYISVVKAIKSAILRSRYRAAAMVNAEMLSLYYGIGKFVSENSRNHFWNSGAIDAISARLQQELPGLRGFSATNMKNMRIFYEEWSSKLNRQMLSDDLAERSICQTEIGNSAEISNRQMASDDLAKNSIYQTGSGNLAEIDIYALSKISGFTDEPVSGDFIQLFLRVGFSSHMEILFKEKDIAGRMFYIGKCATEFWSVDTLRRRLKERLFEHSGKLPNNFELTIPEKKLASKAMASFKGEYLIDYINIEDSDDPDERVIEVAIVQNIRKFIQSLGPQFCFIGNQYHLAVDGENFYIDLLFFHRELRSLVAIELKRGAFKPAYLGQLNFYLSALDDMVKTPDENPSIGLILCRDMKRSIVELAIRDFNKPMGVAVYRTGKELPEVYRPLIPVMEGVRKILNTDETTHE